MASQKRGTRTRRRAPRTVTVVGLLVALAAALPVASAGFGQAGPVVFEDLPVPAGGAPEPTIGIPWNTDSVFYHSGSATWRARFSDSGEASWADVTAPYQVPTNLDPMLIADSDTGRVFAGGLHGACSVMMLSDDDGETWLPSLNMCSGVHFDHQSVGSGPPVGPVPAAPTYPHVAYYCAQGGTISCAGSPDGGHAWLPFQPTPGPCVGFHGHIRVSGASGFVAVPVADCGEKHGYLASSDGGLTWTSEQAPGGQPFTNGFDSSVQFSRPSGWMYYAMANEHGIHVALSKDDGATWESLGAGHGANDTWLDLGALHEPPVVSGVFTNVQAGDDERAAVLFFGLEAGPGADLEFLTSPDIYQCEQRQEELVWRAYLAITYDAGRTWTVSRVSDDPVQVGGVYDVIVDGSGDCRNLLDFNDADIDSTGRLYYGIADGCVDACAETIEPDANGYRAREARLLRQVEGRGLFAAFDASGNATQGPVPGNGTATGLEGDAADADVPGLLVLPAVAAVGAALGLVRWRRSR